MKAEIEAMRALPFVGGGALDLAQVAQTMMAL